MRVLIISHNVASKNNNMGKTLLSYFQDFAPEEVAEFYIQDKLPQNVSLSNNYYRFTDRDALKSMFGIKTKHIFKPTQSMPEVESQTNAKVELIRQYGRKRNALIYTIRNIIWSIAQWKTKEFIDWLKDFNPDVIFFMAGDYGFMYKITLAIKEIIRKPLVVCCVDDHYLFNRNEGSVLGRWQHKLYMKNVHKVMHMASSILTISDSMGEVYMKLFQRPCHTLHTSANKRDSKPMRARKKVAYFGNLSFLRHEQLVQIGKATKELGIEGIDGITVYSSEKNLDNLKGLNKVNGIDFRGEISSSEVAKKIDECIAIIHTESFKPKIQKMIKYSVSTKIADSLMNGPCLIAYGPQEIASIEYLQKNKAAYVISNPADLKEGLKKILTDHALREEIVSNARKIAMENHDESVNARKLRKWLQEACQ